MRSQRKAAMPQKPHDPSQWIDARQFVQGEVYWADDKYVSETVKDLFGLQEKGRRPVMVVQGDAANSVPRVPLILVAPLTASGRALGLDYALPAAVTGLKRDSVVQLSLIQPIPKKALEQYVGTIQGSHLEEIRARLAQKFGLIGAQD